MLEIIATCIDDAIKIEACGGQRVELVSGLTEGGLTPSYALVKNVVERVKIPVNVMIRPHAKSFIYTKEDIEIMREDIGIVKELKANGIVIGMVDENGSIDERNLQKLLRTAEGLDITFHRAIEETKDLVESIKILAKYPQIKRVLTSGGKGKPMDNLSTICRMIEAGKGKIEIMVGGGMTKETLAPVIKKTGTKEVHFGTAVRMNNSPFYDINCEKLKEIAEEYKKATEN